MAPTLYYHPLASFCWKALIALYENGTAFNPLLVDLGDPAAREAFAAVWPVAKFPVLKDGGNVVAEATVIIDYLDAFHPGPVRFVPKDAGAAWRVRLWDRVFDHYVHEPMQKIVVDRLRPPDGNDPIGVAQARAQIREAYGLVAGELGSRPWFCGEAFTLADCAAAPALFYADLVEPLGREFAGLGAYLDRLMARPSFARVLQAAAPYFAMFPLENKPAVPRRG